MSLPPDGEEDRSPEEPKATDPLPPGLGWLKLSQRSVGYIGAAETLTGGLIGLGVIGYLLDLEFDTGPAFLLTGLGIALVVGFYGLARVMFRRGGGQ